MDNKKSLGFQAEILESEISKDEIASALEEASFGLAFASELHDVGAHSEAFRMSLRAAIDAACKFPSHLLEPSRHLFSALEDLNRGSIDPALVPALVSHRKIDATAVWSVRACLALALEARKCLVRSLSEAARLIASASPATIGAKLSRTEQQTRLKNWRGNFRKGKVPEGSHRKIFATGLAQIMEANAASDRTERLAKLEDRFVELAAAYRARGRVLTPHS
jgi:hypothetical protein